MWSPSTHAPLRCCDTREPRPWIGPENLCGTPSIPELRPFTTLRMTVQQTGGRTGTVRILLYRAGEFDPDEITRRVGVTPSETARAGEAIGRSEIIRQNSLWVLHSRFQPSAPIDLQARAKHQHVLATSRHRPSLKYKQRRWPCIDFRRACRNEGFLHDATSSCYTRMVRLHG
jgi:hypothetical protein